MRKYLEILEQENSTKLPMKIKKLSIPTFESDAKQYLKWKDT